jgi:hypothetical protein
MKIEIRNIFWDSFEDLDEWILWFEKNLNPFPIQMAFLLDNETLQSVLNTKQSPINPVSIYGAFYNNLMLGSFVITHDKEDDSAEFTHLILDGSIHKTYISGIVLIEIARYVEIYLKSLQIEYFHTNIPASSSALRKLLLMFGAEQKATLKSYQKIKIGNSFTRRDAIYFEKLLNLKK